MDTLRLRVGGQWRAIDAQLVCEVLDDIEPTVLPRTPECVLGVVVLRGDTLPVICLRTCLEVDEVPAKTSTFPRIVVVESAGMRVGCRCEQVLGVDDETEVQSEPLDIAALLERVRVRG
jgi:chemotaxis signal transduction protein